MIRLKRRLMTKWSWIEISAFCTCLLAASLCVSAQIDEQRARAYFEEAATLCEREGNRLWGISLCGPMVFADSTTQSVVTNQSPPAATWPRLLGFVNAPIEWGGTRWSAYVWSMIPENDRQARGRLMMHELFHRVQPELGLMVVGAPNDHLDTMRGRYWLRLEWRALARALEAAGPERLEAVRDALAFREARRRIFPEAAESERMDELREGLAQYTGTVVAAASRGEAISDAVRQLVDAEDAPTFVRTFAYSSGTAYGLLLDRMSPGWTRTITSNDDLGMLVMKAAMIEPAADAEESASRYGASALQLLEERRAREQEARVAELRTRFVDGPQLIVPRGRGAMLNTTGATPIPGEGTVFFEYRVTAAWGSLESSGVLESADSVTLRLPAPFQRADDTLTGEGWRITLSPGWVVRGGSRDGDFEIVRDRD